MAYQYHTSFPFETYVSSTNEKLASINVSFSRKGEGRVPSDRGRPRVSSMYAHGYCPKSHMGTIDPGVDSHTWISMDQLGNPKGGWCEGRGKPKLIPYS